MKEKKINFFFIIISYSRIQKTPLKTQFNHTTQEECKLQSLALSPSVLPIKKKESTFSLYSGCRRHKAKLLNHKIGIKNTFMSYWKLNSIDPNTTTCPKRNASDCVTGIFSICSGNFLHKNKLLYRLDHSIALLPGLANVQFFEKRRTG